MKAAIVRSFDHVPVYGEIDAPQAQEGDVLVSTTAAAISQLVRAQAAGKHYSSGKTLPFVPGADGVGRLADGTRVYFAFPRAPIGAMAETVAVAATQCVALPEHVDNVTAAAIANPGMSSWAALEARAQFRAGETVLVNGAAGTSGRLAIQIAKHLGASRIVATARKPDVADELRALGADHFIGLDQSPDKLTAAFRDELYGNGIDVVLDYLWGAPAACLLEAASGHGSAAAQPRVRFVNIGNLAGPTLPLPAGTLRSSGLELMGSGLGSVSYAGLVQVIGKMFAEMASAGLKIDARAVPLADVEAAWKQPSSERIVLQV
ncbi:quinone oxidoreductase family protein [Solimonas marina]|uniref:Zinc-binding alcohol dehydrogenase family protein n=1 Tax=Solimonas marina TaxID=2714601 RepID=A0A969W6U1_9GAMM|nr:zinc-binding alcohol dehydrogenase family protein [Solimonas marina]NKF20969.1 zinc-binding alcohol dehydrogenase family protein [Solimonas marina]